MKKLLFLLGLWPTVALAQSQPGWPLGFIPTPTQWNQEFGLKADAVNGTMTGGTFTSPTITGGTITGTSITNSSGNFTGLSLNGQSFGTASTANTGSSGNTVPYLSGNNTWSGTNGFGPLTSSSLTLTTPNNALSVASNSPLAGFYTQGGGSIVSMCPGYNFGCPAIGHIMAQTANIQTTLGNAGYQETGFYNYMIDQTGAAPPWTVSTNYTSASEVNTGTYVYTQSVPSCTSATSGTGPSGTGSNIVDNTCRWTAVGEYALLGKIGIASTVLVNPGGAAAWAGDFDTFIEPGWTAQFATGMEIDVTNNSGVDATGTAVTIPDLYLGGSVGTEPITCYICMSPFGLNGTNYMTHEGIWFEGQYTVAGHDIRISTHGATGTFLDANANFSTSGYYDAETAPYGILLEGNYSSGYSLSADQPLLVTLSAPGANLTGMSVVNSGTTINTTNANYLLSTGNTNSFARIDLFDSDAFNFESGSAITNGMTFTTLAGPITLAPAGNIKLSSALQPSTTLGIVGTTLGDNANAGSVGEYMTNTGSGVSLTSGTAASTATVSLTAGDWQVGCQVLFEPNGTATSTILLSQVNTSQSLGGASVSAGSLNTTVAAGVYNTVIAPETREDVSSTTPVYCMANATYSGSGATMTAVGSIHARRVR